MAKRRTQADKSDASARKVLKAALSLFSRQGFRATTMRQLARRSGLSVGNLYHHFGGKEEIFGQLIDQYWQVLLDPEHYAYLKISEGCDRLCTYCAIPKMRGKHVTKPIEQVVAENSSHILLIYIDVIEFKGKHIKTFYQRMADRFAATYAERLAARQEAGELGEVDPLVGVMLATRWFFYFFTVEKCFGVPMHFGLDSHQAVHEFSKILRRGLEPRNE